MSYKNFEQMTAQEIMDRVQELRNELQKEIYDAASQGVDFEDEFNELISIVDFCLERRRIDDA